MAYFDSNDPSEFGWHLGTDGIVPFEYQGHPFPSGVQELLVPIFTELLDRLCAQPGFELHTGDGLGDGFWGYEDRNVTGGLTKSFHASGNAIDVNAPWNPYGVATPASSRWRVPMNASAIAEPLGLLWGGGPRWGTHRDWMHFENHNSPGQAAAMGHGGITPGPAHPFPLPSGDYYGPFSGPAESISGYAGSDARWQPGLRVAQIRLGVAADGLYGPLTAAAVRRWQTNHGLAVDGLLGPATWRSLMA